MDAPNRLKLETVLFEALRKRPKWDEMLAVAVLRAVYLESRSWWVGALQNVIESGLKSLVIAEGPIKDGRCAMQRSLGTAIVKAALNAPSYEESLRAALAETVQSIPGWQDAFAGELLAETLPGWRELFNRIEPLSRNSDVKAYACILCMVPLKEDGDE